MAVGGRVGIYCHGRLLVASRNLWGRPLTGASFLE
jgi:hypothetical protein